MADTPTNIWRLIAKHQVKFIHWRTITELEEDVNKRLTNAVGKYEVKEIKLDLTQTWALMWVIHYYEQTRLVDSATLQKTGSSLQPTSTSTWHQVAKKRGVSIEWGTKHIAPVQNTPASHNKKETTPIIKPDLNTINNELDKMKPEVKPTEPKPVEPEVITMTNEEIIMESISQEIGVPLKKTKLPEWYEVASTAEPAAEPTSKDVDDIMKEDTRGDLTQEEIDNG